MRVLAGVRLLGRYGFIGFQVENYVERFLIITRLSEGWLLCLLNLYDFDLEIDSKLELIMCSNI